MDGSLGLTNVLIGQAELEDVLQQFAESSVYVIGAGSIPPNPSELLGSTAMRETLRELESRFDAVIIDTPPLLPVTDAAVLSTIAGGTVIVVGAGRVDRDHLAKSLQSLDAVNAPVMGLVLNLIPTKGADAFATYRDGYAPESSGTTKSRKSAKKREMTVADLMTGKTAADLTTENAAADPTTEAEVTTEPEKTSSGRDGDGFSSPRGSNTEQSLPGWR